MSGVNRVFMLLVPRRGRALRVDVPRSDYKAIDAWFRDPALGDVPVRITGVDGREHAFLPGDLVEIAYIGSVPDVTDCAADGG